ncbi:PEP-CTERM sorting domain-containing protein [Fontivita pretiosa]|uniref:PEP-CTERM sorting domain-containing protein n=1 Tax=Fontivita pretiosa TaxID=2989684 RepID=UPI003D167311
MHRSFRSVFPRAVVGVVSIALLCASARANSGTQLPLNQYQAGSESTSSALVTNGDFEQPGSPNPNNAPTGWTLTGSFQVGTPINPPSPASTVGNFAAQGPLGSTATAKFSQIVTLAPNTNYVLSAYLWNFGMDFDLSLAELVDPANPANAQTLALSRTAADGGDGANGYFVYKAFSSNSFSTLNPVLEVEFDLDETVSGTRPSIAAQIDNVAITPVSQFAPPVLIPEPATMSLVLGLGSLLMGLRRGRR